MDRSLGGIWEQPRQRGNDDQFAQFQGGQDDPLASRSEVVLVGMPDLLDEAMDMQAFEQARELGAGVLRQDAAQTAVAEAADLPLAARQGDEEGAVVGTAQVEAAIAAALLAPGLGQALHLLDTGARIAQV